MASPFFFNLLMRLLEILQLQTYVVHTLGIAFLVLLLDSDDSEQNLTPRAALSVRDAVLWVPPPPPILPKRSDGGQHRGEARRAAALHTRLDAGDRAP